jgi:gliding motility-associated-like protein
LDVLAPNTAAAAVWRFGDGELAKELAPVHEYLNDGIYTVEADVTDNNGCVKTISREVEIRKVVNIDVPSAFSPNGDGTNDLYYMNFRNITQMNFRVFNRWGQLVYETDQQDFKWDGEGNNGSLPEGVYVFELDTIDFEGIKVHKKGTITIIR